MACLREQASDGRLGTISCDETGCLFRRIEAESDTAVAYETPKADCLLQLRLRTGDSTNPRWAKARVWDGHRYVEITVDLTEAQYKLVRDKSDRYSLEPDLTLLELGQESYTRLTEVADGEEWRDLEDSWQARHDAIDDVQNSLLSPIGYNHTNDIPPHQHGGTDAPECTTCVSDDSIGRVWNLREDEHGVTATIRLNPGWTVERIEENLRQFFWGGPDDFDFNESGGPWTGLTEVPEGPPWTHTVGAGGDDLGERVLRDVRGDTSRIADVIDESQSELSEREVDKPREWSKDQLEQLIREELTIALQRELWSPVITLPHQLQDTQYDSALPKRAWRNFWGLFEDRK